MFRGVSLPPVHTFDQGKSLPLHFVDSGSSLDTILQLVYAETLLTVLQANDGCVSGRIAAKSTGIRVI